MKLDEDTIKRISELVLEQQTKERKRRRPLSSEDEEVMESEEDEDERLGKVAEMAATKALDSVQASLTAVIDKLTNIETTQNKLSKSVETHTNELKNIKTDINSLRHDSKKEMNEIKSVLNSQAAEIADSKKQINGLFEEIKVLKKERLEAKRRQIDDNARMRRNNLIFHGIPEDENETDDITEKKIRNFIKETMKIPQEQNIQRVHRLGKPRPKTSNGHRDSRPIIVLFAFFKQREFIRSKRFDLDRSLFKLSEDFPIEIREARKALFPKVDAAKKEGKKAAIVYPCRLLVDGKIVDSIDVAAYSLLSN